MTFVINRSAIGPRQQVKIFHYRRELFDLNGAVIIAKCESGQATPFGAAAQAIQQVDERHFTVEPNDGIEARNAPENFGGFEARVSAAHREMRGHTRVAKLRLPDRSQAPCIERSAR